MGYQRKIKFIHREEYGPMVGGYRYKKFRPEPLAVTILKLASKHSTVSSVANAIIDLIKDDSRTKVHKQNVQQSIQYLRRRKFIAFPGKGRFTITKQGRKRLSKFKLDNIRIPKSKLWDGKWRLLVFDIPEELAYKRDYFRKRLKELGFYHFQRSVFVIPYSCETEIDIISEELGIISGVHVITANRFAGDEELVKRYNLI